MDHQVIGPRGGITTEDVSCYTCICGITCRRTRWPELGCADWVNEAGQRAYFPKDKDIDTFVEGKGCDGCGRCEGVMDPAPDPYLDDVSSLAEPMPRRESEEHGGHKSSDEAASGE